MRITPENYKRNLSSLLANINSAILRADWMSDYISKAGATYDNIEPLLEAKEKLNEAKERLSEGRKRLNEAIDLVESMRKGKRGRKRNE